MWQVVPLFLIILLSQTEVLAQSPPPLAPYLRVSTQFTEPATGEVDVYIDDQLQPPSILPKLASGKHTVKCIKRGYFDYEEIIAFPQKDLVTCLMSKTTLLNINVRDSNGNKLPAKVYVDDKFEGLFDGGSFFVRKGSHKISCVKEGYQEFTQTVEVTKYVPPQEGTYYTVECILMPLDKEDKNIGFWHRIWISIVAFFKSLF